MNRGGSSCWQGAEKTLLAGCSKTLRYKAPEIKSRMNEKSQAVRIANGDEEFLRVSVVRWAFFSNLLDREGKTFSCPEEVHFVKPSQIPASVLYPEIVQVFVRVLGIVMKNGQLLDFRFGGRFDHGGNGGMTPSNPGRILLL